MTVSQFEAEPQLKEDNDQSTLLENTTKVPPALPQGRRNPPARNTSRFWFERFLAVIQRQNPSIIDASFVSQIAPSNEGKLLAQLKFLHVVDEQGKPTQQLSMLNMVGDEQKKAFQEIAQESYRDLFGEVKIEKAVPDDLVNFFIRKYSFTRDKAVNAAKFFLYLTEKGSVRVSPELSAFLSEKINGSQPQTIGAQISSARSADRSITRSVQREPRAISSAVPGRQLPQRKKGALDFSSDQSSPLIQAVVSIKLDKDTPKEYWDRVLALVGEKKGAVEIQAETTSSGVETSDVSENVDQELSPDSNFT
jgi:hypothetical protein